MPKSSKKLVNDHSNDKNFKIDVQYTQADGMYSVVADNTHPPFRKRSLAEALIDLANYLIRKGLAGSGRFDPNAPDHAGRGKKCQYCQGRIFFVKTMNGKWMPLDDITVSNQMLNERGFEVTVEGRELQARMVSVRHYGQVFIAHQEVCGSRRQAPENPILLERWEKNRGVTLEATERVTHDLARMAKELGKKAA